MAGFGVYAAGVFLLNQAIKLLWSGAAKHILSTLQWPAREENTF